METVMVNTSGSGTPDITFSRRNEEPLYENLYKVEDRLPCLFSFFNALQILVSQVINLLWLPLLLSPALCILPADPIVVYLVSTAFLTSGVITSIQSTLGIRLPTMAAPSVLYTNSLLSLLRNPNLQCPSGGDLYAMGHELRTLEWQTRLREVQGVLLLAGVFQAILGFTGVQACLSRLLSPAAVAPAVILSGLTMIRETFIHLTNHWIVFLMVVILMTLFTLQLREVCLPLPTFSIHSGLTAKCFPVFRMFPVLWTCFAAYLIYKAVSLFWAATPYPDTQQIAFQEAIDNSKWFFIPYPFEWGIPTLSLATVLHMLPAIMLQSVTSMIMFHGNGNTCDVGAPPCSAVSRGLGVEGLGLVFGSMWGHGIATNLDNVGLMSFTGIVSCSSIRLAALMMICLSHFTRLVALLAYIPVQFLSALHLCLHAGLVCVGISMLKLISFTTPREVSIVGFSLFLGLMVPQWISSPGTTLDTGFQMLDLFFSQILASSVFVATVSGCLLDLILPGRFKNKSWRFQSEENKNCYRLPSWEELLCSILERTPFFSMN